MRSACRVAPACVLVLVSSACGARPPPPTATETSPPAESPAPIGFEIPTAHRVRESSGIVVGNIEGRSVALVADADDRVIRAFDATTLEPLGRTDLDGEPRDLLAAADGRIFVTIPERNEVVTLVAHDAKGGLQETSRTKTAVEPIGMALTPDEDRLLVVTGASHRVEAFATTTMIRRWSIPVAREPRAVIVTSDGGRAVVSHAVASHATVLSLADTDPSIATTRLDFERASSYLGSSPPRSARLGYAMTRLRSPGGELIAMPLVQEAPWGAAPAGYGFDDTPPSKPAAADGFERDYRGLWSYQGRSSFDVRVVHASDGKTRWRGGAPNTNHRCLLPRATIAFGDRVVVACEGGREIVSVRFGDDHPSVEGAIEVGRGPIAIARVPATSRALVWSSLARTLAAVDLHDVGRKGRQPALAMREVERLRSRDARELAGREIFRRTGDPKISDDGIACASCHPDGRDDDLVWSGPHGKRRPPTLAGNAARRGPFGWGGEHATMTAHMTQTVKRLGGKGLDGEALESLAAYVRSLKPAPSDLTAVESDPLATRGKTVFESDRAACVSCHAQNDREPHDVGTGGSFVTPALAGIGARRSLFHDGRYDSLEALLRNSPRMGGAADLRDEDRAALVAYLRTL